jgi:transcriptional regulator NrdR family protein
MVCIYCGHETKVTNSRERARNPSVWRRRSCLVCVAQFSSLELPDYQTSLVVKGPSKKLYPFSRDKLFLSLYKSLGHRTDALQSATALTETVIGRVLHAKRDDPGVITMRLLATIAHLALKRFDPLSAHTYKAYHLSALQK